MGARMKVHAELALNSPSAPTYPNTIKQAFADALQCTTSLEHLELFLPSIFDEDDTRECLDIVFPPGTRRPAHFRFLAGDEIGLDEAEFWEAQSPMCDVGEDQEVCQSLIMLH